jgi:exonuclease SbcC
MIPVKLRLENFLSYRGPVELDFADISVACLWGENGSGKSAILDAITWALWGKTSRTSSSRELVHLGSDEMEVELEFVSGKDLYKVRRTFSRGRTPQEQLYLYQVREGKAWPIMEATKADTQKKIDRLLRMDYDTFINSAFLAQGRAGEFTSKPPSERKEVLGRILGFDFWDRLEEKAKEKKKEAESKERELLGELKQIEEEIKEEKRLNEELKRARAEYEQFNARYNKLQEELRSIEDELHALREKERALNEKRDKLGGLAKDIGEIEGKIRESRRKIESYRETIRREGEVRENLERLQKVRRDLESLRVEIDGLKPFEAKANELERKIAEERSRLEGELKVLKGQEVELARDIASLEVYRRALAEVEEGLALLDAQEKEAEEMENKLEKLAEELNNLRREKDLAEEEARRLTEQLEMLSQAQANCPLCGYPLSSHRKEELIGEFQNRLGSIAASVREREQREMELKREKEEVQKRIQALQESLSRRSELVRKKAGLEEKIERMEEEAQELEKLRARIREIEGILQSGSYALEFKAEREALEEALSKLRELEERWDQLSKEEKGLSLWEREAQKLEDAREFCQVLEKTLVELEKELERKRKEKEDLELEVRRLEKEVAYKAEVERRLKEKEREREEASRKRDDAWGKVASVESQLKRIAELKSSREEKEAELRQVREEKGLYQELAEAVGKNGVQAMIIDTALPEIEREANALLARMTEGRMQVRFETQKSTQGGKVQETLEIKISDEKGARDYKLYSGGESFRVDLAIRIALARLLARRAGAPLSVLFVDEGFGTQDADGLDKVVEAINSIRDEFKFVLVITHLEELKEMFPVRIEVTKRPSGSNIEVVRVW